MKEKNIKNMEKAFGFIENCLSGLNLEYKCIQKYKQLAYLFHRLTFK
jgi:hypothetical protein